MLRLQLEAARTRLAVLLLALLARLVLLVETPPALLEMHLMPHEAQLTLPVVAQVRQFEMVPVT